MDLLRNFISQFKSLQKTDTTRNTNTSNNMNEPTNISLKKPVDLTKRILQSHGDVEVRASETNTASYTKNIENDRTLNKNDSKNINGKNTKENVPKTDLNTPKNEGSNKAGSDSMLLEQLINNTNITITSVSSKRSTLSSDINDQQKDGKQREDLNENVDITVIDELFDIGNGDPKNTTNFRNIIFENEVDETTNSTHSVASVNPTVKPQPNENDQTKNHLKEFDEILAEVQRKGSFKEDDSDLSIGDIDEILTEYLEDDTTYNFQEIKHVNDNDLKTIYNFTPNNTVAIDDLETRPKLDHSSLKVPLEDDIIMDVISISSDDTPNAEIFTRFTENNAEDNIDVISLSSDDNEDSIELKDKTQEETPEKLNKEISRFDNSDTTQKEENIDNGDKELENVLCYHSSDFEFISEEEAKKDGFIINFDSEARNFGQKALYSDSKRAENSRGRRNSKVHNYRTRKVVNNSHMENYAVPAENQFLDMFKEIIPGVAASEIHFLENKSVRTRTPMLVQYEGIGFDMNIAMHRPDSSDDEYREEADESLKKILKMYPVENTKRKRRRRY